MKLEIGECTSCHEDFYIVNRTKWLCGSCNYKRLHNGKSKQEVYSQKYATMPKTTPSPIKKKSAKQRMIDAELTLVYAQINKEREQICTGCGTRYNLTNSHLVPRSENRKLVTVKKNIKKHCSKREDGTEGCHQRWEDPTKRIHLMDYDENMGIIYDIDRNYYDEIKGKQILRNL